MADVPKLMEAASRWQKNFNNPLPLAANSRLAIITCMDSRVHPERIFDMKLGDAEVLRNAGGRVTLDMIRSLVVSQEILKTTDIFVIHHTDCGGQAAVRQHGMLIQAMVDKLPFLFGLVLRLLDALSMTGLLLKPIRNLERSVYEDVEKLKSNPMVPKSIGIYGFLYSTEDGSLKEITRRLPVRGKKLQ
ncbi:TPA: hypothetical protein ACH3X2_007677 [Trebouxia sp. C0005]|nr:MAG: hypothetical protein FRX49_10502 [Trebouxia sp. A1-2]